AHSGLPAKGPGEGAPTHGREVGPMIERLVLRRIGENGRTDLDQPGRLYDADTLAQIWPRQAPAPTPWFQAQTLAAGP
ncbi:MAG: hypothetical protein ACREQ5_22595, partial [Candidatus Dormibacteria bacterium]